MSGGPVTPMLDRLGGTLSYTALAELERCGYRYYLERRLGLTQDVGAGPASSRRGRPAAFRQARLGGDLVHRLLERHDFRRSVDPSAAEIARVARQQGVAVGRREAERIASMLSGLAATPLARRIASAANVRAEQPFCFALRPDLGSIVGAFDAIATERDGTRLVVDYKTGAVTPGEDLDRLVRRDYELQRLIYALAALRDGAATVEVVHWFLPRPDEPVVARFAASEAPLLQSQLEARVEAALERGFAVSATPRRSLCASCPGRGTLCSWPDEVSMRETRVGRSSPEG